MTKQNTVRLVGLMIAYFVQLTVVQAQDMERIQLLDYGLNLSIQLPKAAEVMDNQVRDAINTQVSGEHILFIKIRKKSGLSDLYIKATNMTYEELKESKEQAYLAKNMTGVVEENDNQIIYEYKKDKKYYQLCGIIEIDGKTYMYTSNDSYKGYSLKQMKLLSKIARSLEP